MTPEFSRPLEVAAVAADGRTIEVVASPAERMRLADRFGLPAIESLACRFRIRPLAGSGLSAEGALTARVRQICVVSLAEFEADVAEDFSLRFVPVAVLSADIAVDGPDDIPIVGATVDLGEAAAEQLALALDPFPRRPDLPEAADTAVSGPVSPFAMLKRPPA